MNSFGAIYVVLDSTKEWEKNSDIFRCFLFFSFLGLRINMWQYMAILELGGIRTCFYDAIEESPENIVDDYYYDCDDDDLHDE